MVKLLCIFMAIAAAHVAKLEPNNATHDLFLTVSMLRALDAWEPTFQPWEDRNYEDEIIHAYRFSAHQAPFAVVTDFNGDGLPDVALHGRTKRDDVVLALLSGSSGSYHVYPILQAPLARCESQVLPCRLGMFLEIIRSGTHFTGTFAGYPLTLRRDAFQVVWSGKAAQLYFWAGGKFNTYTTGD